MNKKYFTILIILIGLALFGLAGIQVFWIKNAIIIKESHFDQTVREVMSNVVHKIERLEISSYIKKKTDRDLASGVATEPADSLTSLFLNQYELLSRPIQPIDLSSKEEKIPAKKRITIIDSCGDEVVVEVENKELKKKKKCEKKPCVTLPIVQKDNKKIEKIRYKSDIVSDIFEEIFTINAHLNVENRLSQQLIDSVLKSELLNKGINTEFEFGVFNKTRNLMVYEKTNQYKKELMESNFVINLFPNDIINRSDFLIVYFPKQRNYLVSQLWSMFAISAALILVITTSLVLVIGVIFKQKKLSEIKNDFINNMTHEFKTPISTISLACEALNDRDIAKSEQLINNYLNIIADENKRLGNMAEKVLQTAILDKGQLKLKISEIDIHKIIFDAIKNINLQVAAKGGCIKTQLNAQNPLINGDFVHITNVVYNLLDNANKYTPINPQILVKTENVNNGIKVSISDNGVGISKANFKKIFQRLYRVPTGNLHDVKGFGLGLSYVKAIIEKHNGSVFVESELKLGSTFSFFLPKLTNEK